MRENNFEEIIEGFKSVSDNDVLSYLSKYWNVSPNENGEFTVIGTYKKANHKDKRGNDFANFEDIRNTDGDILYYPFRKFGRVKLWTACNDKLEKQEIWRITVKLASKKYREKNPFSITIANTSFGLPSMSLKEKLSHEAQIRKIFCDTGYTERDAKNTVHALHNIMDDLYSNADDRFIYELLQNADDQPEEGHSVSVILQLLKEHLLFMHDGRCFDANDVDSICSIGDSTKRKDKEKIGYKGIGFKSVFTGSDTVIINSGSYSFAFDKYSPVYGDVDMNNIPWQLKPIWQEKYRYPREIRENEVFWKKRVGISLEIDDNCANDYRNSIAKILSHPIFLLFLKNVDKIEFHESELKSKLSKTIDGKIVRIERNGEVDSSWLVNDYVIPIPKEIREALQDDRNVPEKLKEAKLTQISFAAKVEDRKISKIDNSVLYAYLPTSVNDFGFNFVVNADFLLAANREQLHVKKIWNKFLFSEIGRLVVDWVASLAINVPSYLELLPSKKLKEEEFGSLSLSSFFNNSFLNALEKTAIILSDENVLVKRNEIIIDKTGFSGIVGSDLFCRLIGTKKRLPSNLIDSKVLSEEIFGDIESLKFDDVIEAITNNSQFNDWYLSAIDEQKKALYKWIEDNDLPTRKEKLSNLVRGLSIFQFGTEYKSYNEIDLEDYIITTEHIMPIKDILEKLGFVCSDNIWDENHPLFNFIEIQDEEQLFDAITLRLLEQGGAGLSSNEKFDLFIALREFENIGVKRLSQIEFFNNSENEMSCLNEMFAFREDAPDWTKPYMIAKEECFQEIQKLLQKEFDIVWKNIDTITIEDEIPINEVYKRYRWTDGKYTKELIDKYKNYGELEKLISIVEDAGLAIQMHYLENISRLELSSSMAYSNDSYEYRVLKLALLAYTDPSVFSSKIYFDGRCIKDFSVTDDVVCEYTQSGEKKRVKMSLAKLLPQYINVSDSINKIKKLFEVKKDLDKFFEAKPLPLGQIVNALEDKNYLGLAPGEWVYGKGGNAIQYLFYVYYYNGIKRYTSSWVINIKLENETDSFIYEMMDFLFDNNISIKDSPFSYRIKRYFVGKNISDNFVFDEEKLYAPIRKWADDEKKVQYLKNNGVLDHSCEAITFRRLFLENKPIETDILSDDIINSGIKYITTLPGVSMPFIGDNQKSILLNLKDRKYSRLKTEIDIEKLKNAAKEWDSDEYKKWKSEHSLRIFKHKGLLPHKLIYDNVIMLVYEDKERYIDKSSKTLYVSDKHEIEDLLFETAREYNSGFTMNDYKVLFIDGKVSVTKEDLEEKDNKIKKLEDENEYLRLRLAKYERPDSRGSDMDIPNVTIGKGNSDTLGKNQQYEAQLEAQKRLMQEFPSWTFPYRYGECDDDGKPYHFSTLEVVDENGNTISIVLKSYKKQDKAFKINTTEWDYLIKEHADLLVYTGDDIKRIFVKDLIMNQTNIALSFSTENLDIEERIEAFAESLHYFKELHFDFDSFNISRKAQSVAEVYKKNKRANLDSNNNTEDDI